MSSKKCCILYLVGQLGPGGLERQLYCLLQALDRERYKPAVVVWRHSLQDVYVQQIRALGIPLYLFRGSSSRAKKLILFHRTVELLQPGVIHSYSFHTNFPAFWASRNIGAVAVGHIQSDLRWAKRENGPLLGCLNARWPRAQICNSFSCADKIKRSRSPFVPESVSVVLNGVDLKYFRNLPMNNDTRVSILGVGSLVPVKRWERLLVAASKLKRRGFDFLMKIAGDGPLRPSLVQKTKDLGIKECVKFVGYTNDIPKLLADANFLVHTSDDEGSPNVVIEAMACGRAVVATDAGDVPYLVENAKTGFVICRGDDKTLVKRIETLIRNPDLCRLMGEAGRAKAERDFRPERLVAETLAAYRVAGWRDPHFDQIEPWKTSITI